MPRRAGYWLTGDYSIREAAGVLGCSVSTTRALVKDGHLRGRQVPGRSGLAEWRFTPLEVAAAEAHLQARRARWKPRLLANLAVGRRRSAASRRLRAAARDEIADVEKFAATVAARIGPTQARRALELALLRGS